VAHVTADQLLAQVVVTDGGCWEWTGIRFESGYGRIGHRRAHRVAYEVFVGPIPDGLLVCHHCDNPPCINPADLFLGTSADNSADMVQKGRQARGERQGRHTKPWTKPLGENVGTSKLTDSQVIEIRLRYATGEFTQYRLADEYGVNQAQIGHIVKGETWGHLPGPRTYMKKGRPGRRTPLQSGGHRGRPSRSPEPRQR
jgi:hypothetical protein